MRLLILSGGFGTRLRPKIKNLPKALAPIGGKKFLDYQINNWISQGVTEFIFLLHYKANEIIEFVKNEKKRDLEKFNVQFSIEPEPLGTGGAIAFAIDTLNLNGDFICVNADTWIDDGLDTLNAANSPSIGLIEVQDCSRFGSVSFDIRKKITNFHEKNGEIRSGWVNSGMVKLNSRFFDQVINKSFSLEEHLYPKLIKQNLLSAVLLDSKFIDIGIPADYEKFIVLCQNKRA